MATIRDTDYLFLSTRVRALETRLLDRERMDQMLEAHTNQEAMRLLAERGYPETEEEVTVDSINEMLAKEREATFKDFYLFAPDRRLVDVFKIKYDYHNAKVLLKSEATGQDPARLLIEAGRVPAKELEEAVRSSDLRSMPVLLQDAIVKAREVLGTTKDPQLADFILDRAYFEDMFRVANETGSDFLESYVRMLIDAANLKSIVRTLRMGKNTEFLESVLFTGGNIDKSRIVNTIASGGGLDELYAISDLKEAAEAGNAAAKGGGLTRFEKLCDDAVTACISKAKYKAFGEAPMVAYLAAKENELTAVRIIMTGRLAGLDPDVIRERLRDSYV